MKNSLTRSYFLLVFTALLFGSAGCAGSKQSPDDEAQLAFDDLRAEMQSVVADPERAAQAVALVSELEENFVHVRQIIRARRAEFTVLYADYDSTRADIDMALDEILSDTKSNREVISRVDRQLLDILTAEERDAVQRKHSDALVAAVRALESS